MQNDSFSWHDAKLNAWAEPERIPVLYDVVRSTLKRDGFSFRQDQRIKKMYKSLAKTHHEGRHGDLEFKSARHACMFEVGFFQNIVYDNPNGGRYDFDKLSKMPYLILLRFRKTRAALTSALLDAGLADHTKVKYQSAFDTVEAKRRECSDWHKCVFDPSLRQAYNVVDGDGVVLNDGDVRFFRDDDGRIKRGRVFYDICNNWWVVHNKESYSITQSYKLFSHFPENGRQRSYCKHSARDRVKDELDRAADAMEFEKAAKLRDAWIRLGGKLER